MPFISEITQAINTNLRSTTLTDKRFDKGAFHGIARLVERIEDDKNITIPAVVPNNGDCTELVINDNRPFLLYHRILDLKYERGEANGDYELRREVASMACIVYGDRNILKVEPEQLIAAIEAGFLEQLSETDRNTYQLQSCGIKIEDIESNSRTVYSQEYSGNVEYNLRPNIIMASIKYSITSEYDKSCVDIC